MGLKFDDVTYNSALHRWFHSHLQDLQYKTKKIKEQYEKWGLTMNIAKIKYACVKGAVTDLELGNDVIEWHDMIDASTVFGAMTEKQGVDLKTFCLELNRVKG